LGRQAVAGDAPNVTARWRGPGAVCLSNYAQDNTIDVIDPKTR